ncbi:MAG: putative 2OG-Fe(II) oxygenase [Alphaproteobacteria bacterium]
MTEPFKLMNIFPVPLLIRSIPNTAALNRSLRDKILAREKADVGMTRSNADGWHSDLTLLTWPEPEIASLRKWIDEASRELSIVAVRDANKIVDVSYEAQGWANVNRHGNYNVAHTHPNTHWSMVYYVEMGEPEPGHRLNGIIEFRDPRPRATGFPGLDFGQAWRITPEAGLFLVFPAWLEHMVHPFFGTGTRISLAINVRFTKFQVRDKTPDEAKTAAPIASAAQPVRLTP